MISPERLDILQTHWLRFIDEFAEPAESLVVFDELVQRYAEPHRHYHTLEHIAETLKVAGRLLKYADDPTAVMLAVWFHDVVYEPRRADNEERSVEVMIESLRAFALSQETLTAASTIILATRHTALPATGNERVLVDADLAILGSPEVRYDRYAAGIRAEYAFVSDDDYRHGRRGVLEKFLAREQIFYTPIMAIEGEAAARSNLGRETANLA